MSGVEVRARRGRCVCEGPGMGEADAVGGGPALLGRLGPLPPPSPPWTLVSSLALSLIRGLERSLLNASFGGSNLTLQTPTIQSLVFKLGCSFPGLSLSSASVERDPQVSGGRGRGAANASTPEILQGLKVWTPLPPRTLIWSALIAASCPLCKMGLMFLM